LSLQWQVIELWTLAADDLLAANDFGLVPLVPLAQVSGPPEDMLRRCRQRIDQAPEEEQENLLAVTQVMAQMRYNEASLLSIFGGTPMFDDSPLVLAAIERASVKIRAKTAREHIQQVLETRFDDLSPQIVERLNAIVDERRLRDLLSEAVRCASLDDFRARLVSTPAP
jgi:hypothetical protein